MLSALIRSVLRYPAVPSGQPVNQWYVQHGPLVLVSEPLKSPAPTIDRDRTVSTTFLNPAARATLMGEQPNPWDLSAQDVTSRHRGAKPFRRYELLGNDQPVIPGVPFILLERWPFHAEPPDHYALVSYLIELYLSPVKRPYAITLYDRLPIGLRAPFRSLRYAFGGDHPQSNYPPYSVLLPRS